LIPLAAAYRLAKFNISTDQKVNFKGIPTPITGLALASWVLLFDGIDYREVQSMAGWSMDKIFTHFYVMLYMPLISSYLMISDLDMLSFKFNKTDRLNPYRIGLLVLLAVLFVLNYRIALPVFYFVYIMVSQLAFYWANKNKNE
jgi:CDP-diacylglycerol--serine O-phosphatidyltransferase